MTSRATARHPGSMPPGALHRLWSALLSARASPVGFQRVGVAGRAEIALGPVGRAEAHGTAATRAEQLRRGDSGPAHPSGRRRARVGRRALRLTTPSSVAVLRTAAFSALVAISSAGVRGVVKVAVTRGHLGRECASDLPRDCRGDNRISHRWLTRKA
jgi:hypothetical protein